MSGAVAVANRLVVISPCRDEEEYVGLALRSVVNQTRIPDLWVIVDDGSRDSTADIVASYAARHPWILLVRRCREGGRDSGVGAVDAFNHGLRILGDDSFDVIAKLDCDLEFGPDCFARILKHFENPLVGLAGGQLNTENVFEACAHFHIPGAMKFYRRRCFEEIGGLQPVTSWDILDETDVRRLGWITVSDPRARFVHPRFQGSSSGLLKNRFVRGQGAYEIGTHPLFALARGLYRMGERPWILGSLAFFLGYFSSHLNPMVKQISNRELVHYLRWEQIYRLRHGNNLPPERISHA